ncbi:hypothetical protein JCM33374_g793 [Metschnikowia sp. JCM 33374]|nr:hypothetical protein JCM33374_g793 [Metschnikowia sp. JCM 33374]
MNSDDLPIYPTPQQATYKITPQAPVSSRRSTKPQQYQPAPASSSAHNHAAGSNGYNTHLPPQDYNYQSSRVYQGAPAQQNAQYYAPQHAAPPLAPVATTQYSHQNNGHQGNGYQNNGYQTLSPQSQHHPQKSPPPLQQHRVASTPQQYYPNGPPPSQIQGSPAPRVVSSAAHYGPTSQTTTFHQGYQNQQPAPQTQPGSRNASYSGQQYSHTPVQAPSPPTIQSPVTPQVPPGHVHGHVPTKKPPPSLNTRQRDSVEEHPKPSGKQRLEAELRSTFDRVDTNHSGKISAKELSAALVNFDNTGFQHSTVRLMIKLFSSPSSGGSSGLNFDQFVSLWKYLTAYKKLFVAADVNKSGDISFGEFQRIIEQIGYKLNVDLVLHLFQKFANKESLDDGSVAVGKLKFDAFIELLVYLRKLTDIFKQYDKQLTGVATIDYSDFLLEISNLT